MNRKLRRCLPGTGVIVLAIVIVSLSVAEMYKSDSQLDETNTTNTYEFNTNQ